MRWIAVLQIGLAALGMSGSTLASDEASKIDRSNLKGVRSFGVVIEDLVPEAEAALPQVEIRTAVELRIRQFGLQISDKADAYLYVRLSALPPDPGKYLWAYSVELSFNECGAVRTSDHRSLGCVGVWDKGSIATVGSAKFRDGAQDTIRSLTDQFINDFLAANPRAEIPAAKAP